MVKAFDAKVKIRQLETPTLLPPEPGEVDIRQRYTAMFGLLFFWVGVSDVVKWSWPPSHHESLPALIDCKACAHDETSIIGLSE